MESLSSESKSIALDILEDILSAINRLEDVTNRTFIEKMLYSLFTLQIQSHYSTIFAVQRYN